MSGVTVVSILRLCFTCYITSVGLLNRQILRRVSVYGIGSWPVVSESLRLPLLNQATPRCSFMNLLKKSD